MHQQLSFRSCCKYTIAIHGKQEIMGYYLKQQSKMLCSEKKEEKKPTKQETLQ